MRFSRYVAVIAVLTIAALSMLGAGGGTSRHLVSDGGTTYAPPPPPKPFYERPAWVQRFTPYSGCTHLGICKHWALPAYVVSCESGGLYHPDIPGGLNFGGAYGLLESTWQEYGGGKWSGAANEAREWQQDMIAHKVWVDVGPGGWECA